MYTYTQYIAQEYTQSIEEGLDIEQYEGLFKEASKLPGNYPMHRYIETKDITDELVEKYGYKKNRYCLIDMMNEAPCDDDTNYTVLASTLIDKYGRDFTPYDVMLNWAAMQTIDQYCTAEFLAYCNFTRGYKPPVTAIYKNPCREWIGAQIRADYYGYINPGNPEAAADMAWRDASISHIKNGIYGEMFVAAMIASAAVTDNIEEIILSGLSQIPTTSRLYERIMKIFDGYKNGISCEKCFSGIHSQYNEYDPHCWTHTISNAEIVTASLLYDGGDFGKSICLSVQTGFDTDCNGATVGSILGMRNGFESIDEKWYKPFNNNLLTTVFAMHGSIDFETFTDKIMEHINLK